MAQAIPNIQVGLSQINNSFSEQNYFPLAVGMLQAYASEHLTRPKLYNFSLPLYRRMPIEEAVHHLDGSDVVFFSIYVWNYQISLEIARHLKIRSPETLIVFGGPHVPNRSESFLNRNRFIDLACHGEGELVGTAILEHCQSRDWTSVPGVSFLSKDGQLIQNPKAPRIESLTDVPSPYLNGIFNPLLEAYPKENWIALWETNRGCPFSCTFCDWGSATQSKVHAFDLERLHKEVDWFSEHQVDFIFCCDANFGILPRDVEIATYVAEVKAITGFPAGLSVQNTKNATNRAYQVQKILSEAGLNKGVDIALQSVDSETLKSISRRNISTDAYQALQKRFASDGVDTYTDLILGLPGETYDAFADGVSLVIANGQHNRIQFNNLSILPNAEMGNSEYQETYGMLSVQSKTINTHGSLDDGDEINETQMLVIATKAMPKNAWRNARVFSWMAGLLHFDKVLQIPFILIHECYDVSYRDMIEEFSLGDLDQFPILRGIRDFFLERAEIVQSGGPEFVQSSEWLNIWWPADEYILIKLSREDLLPKFYEEAESLLNRLLTGRSVDTLPGMVSDAIKLNQKLIKQPFQTNDLDLELGYNIWESYRSVTLGKEMVAQKGDYRYHLDRTSFTWSSWDEWCREVIWYGNKRGAYLYGNNLIEPQLSGHY